MSDAIIVALITGGLTLLGTVITVWVSHSSTIAKMDKNSAVADEKIEGELREMKSQVQGEINVIKADIRTLSNRVEAHNKMIERTYELERRADVLEEKAKAANRRLDDLERSEKHD